MPDVQKRLRDFGIDVRASTPAQAADAYTGMRQRTSKIVEELGISLNPNK